MKHYIICALVLGGIIWLAVMAFDRIGGVGAQSVRPAVIIQWATPPDPNTSIRRVSIRWFRATQYTRLCVFAERTRTLLGCVEADQYTPDGTFVFPAIPTDYAYAPSDRDRFIVSFYPPNSGDPVDVVLMLGATLFLPVIDKPADAVVKRYILFMPISAH